MAANWDAIRKETDLHAITKEFHERKKDDGGYDIFPGHQNQVNSDEQKQKD